MKINSGEHDLHYDKHVDYFAMILTQLERIESELKQASYKRLKFKT
jgi:hypothetical protein